MNVYPSSHPTNGSCIDNVANAVLSAVPNPARYNFFCHGMLSSKQSTINIPNPDPTAPAAIIDDEPDAPPTL